MIQPGQVWEFCGECTVLVVEARPDLDERFTGHGLYWDVVILRNIHWPEDEGRRDWFALENGDSGWVRLA